MNLKGMTVGLSVLAAVAAIGFTAGGFHTVDNGEYVVVKSVSGSTKIIDEPGWYVNYGTETYYPDYMTLDFGGDRNASADASIAPIAVKYAEGGQGNIRGNVQVALPKLQEQRMALHEKFHGPKAFMSQLVTNTTGEALTFTAGLMESQEAYMTHRAQFRTAAKDQLQKGLYATKMEKMTRVDSKGGEVVSIKAIPLTDEAGKTVRQDDSPFAQFGVTVTQFNIQDWDFEKATMDRIAEKRDAENKVITSRARTETAEQDKKEAEAIAAKNKAIKEGQAQAAAAVQIVNANRDKELAVIVAQRKVDVAKELKNQRGAELEAARLEAKAIEVMSVAEAEAADRKIKAGGVLSAEQRTQIAINEAWADAYARKAVPQYNVGDNGQGGSSMDSTQQAMQTLTLKAAQDLVAKPAGK